MDKKTIIYNAESVEDPNEKSLAEFREGKKNQDDKSSANYVRIGLIASAGIAGGILGTYLAHGMDNNELSNIFQQDETSDDNFRVEILADKDLPFASNVNDSMSYEEAFSVARDEVGGGGLFVWNGQAFGTFTKDEWENLSTDEQEKFWGSFSVEPIANEKSITEYDFSNMQVAESVNDSMSFGEAFSVARSEVGSDGVFLWHGKPFNTLYKEEWDNLSDEAKDGFISQAIKIEHEDYNPDIPDNQNRLEVPDEIPTEVPNSDILNADPVAVFPQDGNFQNIVNIDSDDMPLASIAGQDTSDNENLIVPIRADIPDDSSLYQLDSMEERNENLKIQIQDDIDQANVHDKINLLSKVVDIGQLILNVGSDIGVVPGIAGKIYDKIFKGVHLVDSVDDSIASINDHTPL